MDLVDPLGRYNLEDYSTPHADTVLNKDHCGLTNVK